MKAEQYLRDVMTRYRNKLVYDVNTGEIRDDKRFMSMMEDFGFLVVKVVVVLRLLHYLVVKTLVKSPISTTSRRNSIVH